MRDINGSVGRIATSPNWAAAHRLVTVVGLPLALAALSWLVLRVEGMDAAFAERDGAIALVVQTNVEQDNHLRAVDATIEYVRDRQSARVPIFDRMVIQVEDHEKRLQVLERTAPRGSNR